MIASLSSAPNVVVAAIASAFTIALLPLIHFLCIRLELFDAPGPLKIHIHPVPRLGGAAIFVGTSVALVVWDLHRTLSAWPFFAALALVWTAGFLDDLRGLAPAWRLGAQFSAGILLWTGGWYVPFTSTAFALLANCALVAALANAVNLLDGMDAVATGVSVIMIGSFLMLPLTSLSAFARTVACAAVAACLSFLPSNWPSARQFLGDCGSNLLGFLVAFLALDFYHLRPPTHSALFFPALVAALPLLDAIFAGLRRLLAHQSPLYGDRRQVYDLAAARGSTILRISLTMYIATAIFVAIGLYGVRTQSPLFWVIAILSLGFFIALAIHWGSLRCDSTEGASTAQNSRVNNEGASTAPNEGRSVFG